MTNFLQMYEHILEIERQVFWMYGNVTCAAYPLQHIDTISEETGEINTNSAMYHIVQGVRTLSDVITCSMLHTVQGVCTFSDVIISDLG